MVSLPQVSGYKFNYKMRAPNNISNMIASEVGILEVSVAHFEEAGYQLPICIMVMP